MKTLHPNKIKIPKVELKEELKLKEDQIKDKEARLNGGVSPILKREVKPITKEIEEIERVVEMKEIELKKDRPLQPKYEFEQDLRWCELRRIFASEEIDLIKKRLELLRKQNQDIRCELPILQERVADLKKQLGE